MPQLLQTRARLNADKAETNLGSARPDGLRHARGSAPSKMIRNRSVVKASIPSLTVGVQC